MNMELLALLNENILNQRSTQEPTGRDGRVSVMKTMNRGLYVLLEDMQHCPMVRGCTEKNMVLTGFPFL